LPRDGAAEDIRGSIDFARIAEIRESIPLIRIAELEVQELRSDSLAELQVRDDQRHGSERGGQREESREVRALRGG
jgi:hypothetical protein